MHNKDAYLSKIGIATKISLTESILNRFRTLCIGIESFWEISSDTQPYVKLENAKGETSKKLMGLAYEC